MAARAPTGGDATVGRMSMCRAPSVRTPAASVRRIEDERHAQRRLIREDAVRRFAVLVERFAVVGGEDDQRPAGRAGLQQRFDQMPDRRVRGRHVPRIRIVAETRRERFRGGVRKMRFVQVHPAERRLPRLPFEPGSCTCHGLGSRPFLLEESRPGRARQVIVVFVEPSLQAEPCLEREGADERAGPVPALSTGSPAYPGSGESGNPRCPARRARTGSGLTEYWRATVA